MKKVIQRLQGIIQDPSKGQSLVEMAVITPILIFMMIGVFEVGWVLRNYLVLVNLDRELARFAIRPGYLDYSIKDVDEVGYNLVMSHTQTISGQLNADFSYNTTMVISHLVVDTGLPCQRSEMASCDCEQLANDDTYYAAKNFTYDDVILHPKVEGFDYYVKSFPSEPLTNSTNLTINSLIDYEAEAARLARRNNRLNCEFISKQEYDVITAPLQTSPNNLIIVEIHHEQPQLFGFPVISNPLTDPIPLYARTTMRLISAARSAQGTQSLNLVGPICDAYPWYMSGGGYGVGDTVDALSGWLEWGTPNYEESADEYLEYAVQFPQMAINEFHDGGAIIAVGETVNTRAAPTGATATWINDYINNPIGGLRGERIIVPIVDGGVIADFAAIRITDTLDIDITTGLMPAVYEGSVAGGVYCAGEVTP